MALITSSSQNIDLIKLKAEIESYSFGTENTKFLVRGTQINSSDELEIDVILASTKSPDLTSNQLSALTTLVQNHQNNQRKRIIVSDAPDANDAASNKGYVDQKIADLVNSAPSTLDTLNELAIALNNDANFATTITNILASKASTDSLAVVATSGSYEDLINKPILFSGSYTDLTNKPTLFDGAYSSLTGAPTLATVATSGSYNDLTDAPTLFDGAYSSLTGAPTLATVATSGSYSDLSNTPAIPASLSGLTQDVSITSPTNSQILQYNGISWVNAQAPVTGATNLDGLTDVTITNATKGQFLVHNGTQFVNSNTILATQSVTPLTIRLAASQSSNAFEIKNSTNVYTPFAVNDNGNVFATQLSLSDREMNGSSPRITISLSTGQSAEPLLITNSMFQTVFAVDSSGSISVGSVPVARIAGTLPISSGGTGQTTAQAAINALTQVSPATTGYVLTKHTDGNASWQPVAAVSALIDGGAGSPALYFSNDTNTGLYRKGTDRMGFVANGQPALTVDGTSGVGRLSVGDIATTVSRLQLVDDNNNPESGITLGSGTATGVQIYKSANSTLTITGKVLVSATTNNGAYNLQCNGTGVWGAGAYVNGSDERIKENITPLENTLDVVTQLNPVTYNYKQDWSTDQSTQPGFIAQEVLEVLGGTSYVNGIVQNSGQYLSMAYQNLIPLLVKSIKELNTKIEELDARIKELENK